MYMCACDKSYCSTSRRLPFPAVVAKNRQFHATPQTVIRSAPVLKQLIKMVPLSLLGARTCTAGARGEPRAFRRCIATPCRCRHSETYMHLYIIVVKTQSLALHHYVASNVLPPGGLGVRHRVPRTPVGPAPLQADVWTASERGPLALRTVLILHIRYYSINSMHRKGSRSLLPLHHRSASRYPPCCPWHGSCNSDIIYTRFTVEFLNSPLRYLLTTKTLIASLLPEKSFFGRHDTSA